MKNEVSFKDKTISKYLDNSIRVTHPKRSNINVLLNRIETDKKIESRKKLYFSTAASVGLILFGLIIF